MKIYSEEKAKQISERKESIENAQYNKKSNARRGVEELNFFKEMNRIMEGYSDLEHLDYE